MVAQVTQDRNDDRTRRTLGRALQKEGSAVVQEGGRAVEAAFGHEKRTIHGQVQEVLNTLTNPVKNMMALFAARGETGSENLDMAMSAAELEEQMELTRQRQASILGSYASLRAPANSQQLTAQFIAQRAAELDRVVSKDLSQASS